jgi:hypothetical protein
MTADSALTTYYPDGRTTYDTTTKSFAFPGIGCVTTWGEKIHNKIGRFYYEQKLSPDRYSITDLAKITYHYLTNVYNPSDGDLDDVGYHVGGFDQSGAPRFFHIFWGFDRPKPLEQQHPDYKFIDHSKWNFVYNGRNDIAHAAVTKLIEETKLDEDIQNLISTSDGAARFCDFIARFAAEMTPEVGAPFYTYIIFPDNSINLISNESLSPFSLEKNILRKLENKPIILFADDNPSMPYPFSLPTGIVLPELSLNFHYEYDNLRVASNYSLSCSNCGRSYYADGAELVMGILHFCPNCRNE